MSDDAMTNDKLMILIHGSGVVRAGQWARRYNVIVLLSTSPMFTFIYTPLNILCLKIPLPLVISDNLTWFGVDMIIF